MAEKVQVLRVCDLHDDETVGFEAISFAVDGESYEIDLCEAHASELRDSLAPFVAGARRAGGRAASGSRGRGRARSSGGASSASSGGAKTADIRSWARSQGLKVNERGRIPAEIVREYEKAHA